MDHKVRQEIKEHLHKQIQELLLEIRNMEERAQTVSLDQPIGRLSRMDSLTNQGIMLSSLNKARIRLARLKMALKSIDDPEFGLCKNCGEEIALKRLKAMPESTLCIHCAS
jgi:DnaK suppressor protein